MSKILNVILIAILLMVAITACSPEKKARRELVRRNIAYTEASFSEYVEKGDKAVVDLFLTAGMSPDAKSKEGISALTIATRGGHTEIVTLLLEKGVDVNAKDNEGYTTLSIAATNARSEIVTLLLAKGADVNAKDNEGWTALMEAARLNNVEVVKILIDKGADVNAKNKADSTALMIAKNKTWRDIVDILEKAGATIPKESIEGLLTVADSQWQKGDYQNALQNYQEILSLDPNNSKAKEFLKKYSAVELTHEKAESIFKKWSGYDEFKRKEQESQAKEFLTRKEAYYELTDDFAISEYDFKKQRFTVTVGSKTGKKVGEAIPVSYALLIVNKNGRDIELFLNMNESNAASFRGIKKKLFIIYKLIKVEEYTYFDPLEAQLAIEMGLRGNARYTPGYKNSVRRYIEPLYVALLIGNEKYVLYEEKMAEQAKQIKDYKKAIKRK